VPAANVLDEGVSGDHDPGTVLLPKSLFPTFDWLLSLALVMAMIGGHDHYRDPCS
jgi:hypothetical protein